ncbi:MAG: YihY/virulence factor BrkB family protein [Bacteroides sp.]|nr:YihY/virulence factor BrkB family protein [Roseburia sp.]MCM1346610.1 YihY/virulence factor BrkB family protein [Bacteroides sp.]MCM1421146.1 YihY/virulence factor BrkB family protein [Bacteroides sp.]
MKFFSYMRRKWWIPFKIAKETFNGVVEDNVTRLSASLAFATLFSIIPFFSLLITIGAWFDIDLTGQLYEQLEPVVGREVIYAFQSVIENARQTEGWSVATVVSICVSVFGATTVFAEIQGSLNTIWGIKAVPKKGWLKFLKNRLLSFSIILIFAFIMLVTFSVTNLITKLSYILTENNPLVEKWVVMVVGLVMNIVVTASVFTLIFKVLPDAKIKVRDVCIGALVTTVLLIAGQWGISFYIGVADVGSVYGAAAFMAIFITWIYYSAIIIYTGAEFTKAWANELGGKIVPDEYAVAVRAVEVRF